MGPVNIRFKECNLFQQTLRESINYSIIELMFIILKHESLRLIHLKIFGFKISDAKHTLVSRTGSWNSETILAEKLVKCK